MKRTTYPSFIWSGLVCIQLPVNKSYQPDIKIKVAFYVNFRDEVEPTAKREAVWTLSKLGVSVDTLKDAYFETEDGGYTAVDPKGVRREFGDSVEAFYLHDPKKRDQLIRQRRLVPDCHAEMVRMYGRKEAEPVSLKPEAVPV